MESDCPTYRVLKDKLEEAFLSWGETRDQAGEDAYREAFERYIRHQLDCADCHARFTQD